MQKLELKDLFSALDNQPNVETNNKSAAGTNATQEFLVAKSQKVEELPLKKQLELKRQATYRSTQQQMDKWIGIVKLNREKDSLNFAKSERDNAAKVNFFPATPLNQFHSKIEGQLKQMELQSQQIVMKKEQTALQKLSKEQAKERLQQARKQRSLIFNQQIKRRRIAKIKSKLYHKIKKRQKVREEAKRIEGLDNQQRNQYLEKLAKQRIHQRITLRHKSKNKHIQSLLRFSKGNKTSIQDSINQVNLIRRQQLQKVNEGFVQKMSEQYDQDNYREQALKDLQKQIDEMENQKEQNPTKGLDGMKFMRLGREKEMNQAKRQAKHLLHVLQNSDNQKIDIQQESQQQELDVTRRKFGDVSQNQQPITNKQDFTNKNLKTFLSSNSSPSDLTAGIDINRLKAKYQTNRVDLDLRQAIQKNKDIFNVQQNEAITDNYRQFEALKNQDYEADLPVDQKKIKGWGSWAGPGISERKVDQALQIKKKLAKIQQIKKKRRDGQLSGVIVRQTYNKSLKDYFVNKLPHNFKSVEQFDYLQDQKIGPEWNTLNQFKSNIKPKIITKAGQVIEAIKMPKKLEKQVGK